uniref:Amine oxidase n=1 Tax=Erpetoichthys calabaricus TaxID=27687 RepID=A0A8C4T9V3_ERPCA
MKFQQNGQALKSDNEDDLNKCFMDQDYEELLEIARKGLPKTSKPKKIIIVGGGIAGLTAAQLLEEAGHEITIFEASDRIGGRVYTYREKNNTWYAELGAMRIPTFHKILLTFIEKLHLTLNSFIEKDINSWYYINGILKRTRVVDIDPDVLNYTVYHHEKGKTVEQLYNAALAPVKDYLKKTGYNCSKVMEKYDSYTVKEYFLQVGRLSQGAVQMIGDMLDDTGFFYNAFTENLRLLSDLNDQNRYYEIRGGMDNLVKAIYQKLNSTVYLNSRVTKIMQNQCGVTVSYNNQKTPADDLSFSADYVLLTATAKASLLLNYEPALSRKKMQALRLVHYSGSTKIFLSFKCRFWEKQGIFGGKSITDLPSRFIFYPSHSFEGTNGGVLLASYTYGEDSDFFNGLNEKECMKVALRDLAKIHGEHIYSLWDGGVVKKWGRDPFSLGAFSILNPYQLNEYYKDLFAKEERIHFAGEHTALPHGWIETSMKSAIRAARNIHNIKNNDIVL